MKSFFQAPSVQIVLCLLAFWWLASKGGPLAIVWFSPLLGAAICYPIYNLIANIRHGVRSHIWLPVHGNHYVFKGITVHVLEDDDYCRWISVADMQKIAGVTASERALEVTYPERFKRMGSPERAHLRDDALVEHLAKESNPVALRFRTWADRDISMPGQKIRRSRNIRPDPPYAD
ncbi:MAG: hypothetical protein ACAH21_02160 [Ramlibacter sp.]|nr:hypothetical protein [Ramlibacter sp.]